MPNVFTKLSNYVVIFIIGLIGMSRCIRLSMATPKKLAAWVAPLKMSGL